MPTGRPFRKAGARSHEDAPPDGESLSRASRFGLMLLVTAPMAICYTAIKAGLAYAPPLRFAGLRTLLAGIALIMIVGILKMPLWPRRSLARWIPLVGLTATTLTFGMMFTSPAFTGAGIASVLGNTQPLAILVLAAIFLGETLTARKIVSLGIGLAGVTVLAAPSLALPGGSGFEGGLLALGASVSAGAASVMLKKLRPGRDLLALTAWQLIAGSLPLLGLSLVWESGEKIQWTRSFLGLLLFLSLAGTALSIWLWFWLLQKSEAGTLSLYLFAVPVFGLLLAYVAFGETLNGPQMIGVLLILFAIGIGSFQDGIDESKSGILNTNGNVFRRTQSGSRAKMLK